MKHYLGIDIGGTSIKSGIVDETGRLLTNLRSPLPTDWPGFIDCIAALHQSAWEQYAVEGIALSTPGIVNPNTGTVSGIVASPISYLLGSPFFELSSRLNTPVSLEQDANCAVLGEYWVGNAQGCSSAVALVLGTGLGGGVLLDGRIHRGAHMLGGDIGYACMTPRTCERSFSWHMAPVTVERQYTERTGSQYTLPMMHEHCWHDPVAAEIYDTFLGDLANTILLLQYVIDPEVFLLGGGISEWELLIPEVNRKIMELGRIQASPLLPHVVACKYKNSANIVGAVYHFRQRLGL
jgi:predicted NBD/HSP70 family sugar kinase